MDVDQECVLFKSKERELQRARANASIDGEVDIKSVDDTPF